MAKGSRGRRGIASRQCRPTPYPLPSHNANNCSKTLKKKKDWENATCSVCMESPHNAVLLLCSSYDKGCRPYMCGTSFRYSNCLDQYKKAAHVKSEPSGDFHDGQSQPFDQELVCPLCRGQVKGWTVVDAAREHLNSKSRSCVQDECSFIGTFRELRKHVKSEHPCAKPRKVDPTLEQKWRRLERDRERQDVMSTIRSSTPGAVFFGDYVIEGNNYSDDDEGDGVDRNLMSMFLFLQAFGNGNGSRGRGGVDNGGFEHSEEDTDDDEYDGNGDEGGGEFVSRIRGRRLRGGNGGRR